MPNSEEPIEAWDKLYQAMKLRVAGYSLNLSAAVRTLFGEVALKRMLRQAAEVSARQKAEGLKGLARDAKARALAERLTGMLSEFASRDVSIEEFRDGRTTVMNPECGCLPPFTSRARDFNFTPEEARRYTCMQCMPSYAKAASLLGVKFKGGLTERGCVMEFGVVEKSKHETSVESGSPNGDV